MSDDLARQQHWFPVPEEPTIRDRFAAAVVTGLVTGISLEKLSNEWFATTAYAIADAMLKERNK